MPAWHRTCIEPPAPPQHICEICPCRSWLSEAWRGRHGGGEMRAEGMRSVRRSQVYRPKFPVSKRLQTPLFAVPPAVCYSEPYLVILKVHSVTAPRQRIL